MEQKEKRMKKNKSSLCELWDTIKQNNIWIMGVSEGEEREKGAENITEQIIAENYPNLRKKIDI